MASSSPELDALVARIGVKEAIVLVNNWISEMIAQAFIGAGPEPEPAVELPKTAAGGAALCQTQNGRGEYSMFAHK